VYLLPSISDIFQISPFLQQTILILWRRGGPAKLQRWELTPVQDQVLCEPS
jgi:hypothetical protein